MRVLAAVLALLALVTPAHAADALLVDAAALDAQRTAADVRIVDMADELADYQRGHIPGAVHLDVDKARVAVGRAFRVPTPEEGAKLLGALGITPETRVVIYDDAGSLNAAWFFYVLETLGHPRAAILDGGIAAWKRAGLPLSTETPAIAATSYRPAPPPERATTAAWVREHLQDRSVALLDARSTGEYSGAKKFAKRGGHIPGAVNVEWQQNLRPAGTFKSLDELRALYTEIGRASCRGRV